MALRTIRGFTTVFRNDLQRPVWRSTSFRQLTVLAIETSCDDTSVAIVESDISGPGIFSKKPQHHRVKIHSHKKVTANNDAYTGIHPLVALQSHRRQLASLTKEALCEWRESYDIDGQLPDLVAVTRGPGMRSNLSVGLDTAKGLAVAWDKPLVGVHHMQAHALTPRLANPILNAKRSTFEGDPTEPKFPFLTMLASGGHTMLINSTGLTHHATLAETQDIALGEFLDKAARAILPPGLLRHPFGKALEDFAFSTVVCTIDDSADAGEDTDGRLQHGTMEYTDLCECAYNYHAPARRQEELERRPTEWGWSLAPPLADSKGGEKSPKRMVYSFSGSLSHIERIMKYRTTPDGIMTFDPRDTAEISLRERQTLAREAQRVAFEHLASRIFLHLAAAGNQWEGDTIVVSGGVASNKFLRHVLRSMLDARGYHRIKLAFPPIEFCTDNAVMIAWAAIEMYEAGYKSSLDIEPIRKWSMDSRASDGGILGVGGWIESKGTEWDEDD